VTNTTAGGQEYVEATQYQDNLPFWDYAVHVDLGPSSFTDTPILDIENALADPKKTTFANQPNPSGNEVNFFRFSLARSQSTWNLAGGDTRGKMLARFYWDFNTNRQIRTNYFDPRGERTPIRLHTFGDHVQQSRPVTVALEIMRPDETPDDSIHVATRIVTITRVTPFACASFETVTTWRTTDQYLKSSCSTRGPEIRYRWQFTAGGPWTPYSPDTLYDFSGHTGTGPLQVTLGVLNTSTGQTSTSPRTVTVQSGQVGLNGPIYVTDKGTKLYSSNISGQWFERYNPDLRWYPATAYYQTSMTRIWPAGDYTVELRQQDSTLSLVRRGRLHITRCHSNPTPCQPLAPPAFAASDPRDTSMGIFGAGPWITWGSSGEPQMTRFYDLAGAHDLANPFSDGSLSTDSGTLRSVIPGRDLSWRHLNLGLPGVRAVTFDLSGFSSNSPLAFGLAVDPDLGTDPAGDQSGFDPALGLVYVSDDTRIVGFLVRSASENALVSVQQYGVGRWSPATPDAAWSAQRAAGARLMAGKRDVQLLLSAAATGTPARYTWVTVSGLTLTDVRAKAEAALVALASVSEPR
jgi:hypothetical protein